MCWTRNAGSGLAGVLHFVLCRKLAGTRNWVPNLPGIPWSYQLPYLLGMAWAKAGICLPAAIYQLAYHW